MSSIAPNASPSTIRVTLRIPQASELDQLVGLNNAELPQVDHVTPEQMQRAIDSAAYVRVADLDGQVVGLLVGYRSTDTIETDTIQWFRERYPDFLYIDRIVVGESARRMGLGGALYEDFAEFGGRSDAPMMACNVSVRPRNEPGLQFHKRQGFKAVGEYARCEGELVIMLTTALESGD